MALPKDLKKDMEGEAGEEKVKQNESAPVAAPAPVEPAPARLSAQQKPTVVPDVVPVHTPTPVQDPKSTPVHATDNAILAKINQRLMGLEEDLAELMEEFDAYSAKTFNYSPIFKKIEAAQADLEKLMAAQTKQDKPENEPQDRMEELLQKLVEKQENNDRQLVRYLRENANFQVQVRQQMQSDLDELREQQAGSHFNPILKEIASMYADYQMLLEDDGMSQKTRKNLVALFGQMEDLLMDYDAEVCVSKVGEERPKHRCRIITQIPTGDKSQHNTIAKARKPGVIRGRLVLSHEFVDVFVYDPALDPALNVVDEKAKSNSAEIPVVKFPVEAASTEQATVEKTPTEEAPVEKIPAEEVPVEEAPAEEAPAEEVPVEEAPAEEAPAEEVPAEETPDEETPVEEAPAEESSDEQPRKKGFFNFMKR